MVEWLSHGLNERESGGVGVECRTVGLSGYSWVMVAIRLALSSSQCVINGYVGCETGNQ